MFWVRIRLGGHEYLGVLDTGATISIVAKKILPCGSLKNTMTTAAIRMGDGNVVHSCGDCEVEVPMGSGTVAHRFYVMDTEAFDFVLGTDFFVQHSKIQSLTLQAPYLLYVDHGSGRESVPLEQSEHTSSYLRLSKEEPSNMMAASKTEDYQLLGEVLDQGLKELGYSREYLSVELFASDKQHVLDLYCSKGQSCSYKLYWPSFGMAYGNPRFSELGKVLTKVALERSRMVLCSPDLGAHGGNEYWRNLVDRLTISSVRLSDEAIYVPLGRKTPMAKPGWGSMLSVVDGGLTSIPWEDLDPTPVQAIQRESDGLALGDLKDRLRPQDAIETLPEGEEYVVTDTNAPHSPCHVPVPDGVSECGLSELPSSIHSDDETEHDAFFVQTCVEEVESTEYVAPLKPLLSMRVEDQTGRPLSTLNTDTGLPHTVNKYLGVYIYTAEQQSNTFALATSEIRSFFTLLQPLALTLSEHIRLVNIQLIPVLTYRLMAHPLTLKALRRLHGLIWAHLRRPNKESRLTPKLSPKDKYTTRKEGGLGSRHFMYVVLQDSVNSAIRYLNGDGPQDVCRTVREALLRPCRSALQDTVVDASQGLGPRFNALSPWSPALPHQLQRGEPVWAKFRGVVGRESSPHPPRSSHILPASFPVLPASSPVLPASSLTLPHPPRSFPHPHRSSPHPA